MVVIPARAGHRRRLRRHLIREFQIDPAELKAIDRDRRRRTAFKIVLPFIVFNVIVVTGACILLGFNINWVPSIRGLGLIVGVISRMAVICGLFSIYFRFIMFPLLNRLTHRDLLAVLREHGYDLCPKCGYRWDGLPGPIIQCPECGTSGPKVGNTK